MANKLSVRLTNGLAICHLWLLAAFVDFATGRVKFWSAMRKCRRKAQKFAECSQLYVEQSLRVATSKGVSVRSCQVVRVRACVYVCAATDVGRSRNTQLIQAELETVVCWQISYVIIFSLLLFAFVNCVADTFVFATIKNDKRTFFQRRFSSDTHPSSRHKSLLTAFEVETRAT